MAIDLEGKIISQIEYYFGDINLPRDKFMQEKIKEDEGWVSLDTLLTFKRLANLSKDPETIVAAVEKSENKLVEISEDRKKLRRNPEKALPEFNEERKKELAARTAYAKGFPIDEVLDNITEFVQPYGPVESVQMRSYVHEPTKEHKFKGSCFIIFKDAETCKKFVEAEDIKYKEKDLIRKMQLDYFADKKEEFANRRSKKEKKKEEADAKQKKEANKFEIQKGVALHFKGIKEGQSLTREDIKDKIKELTEMETAFLDFNKGDLEGHIRMRNENDGHALHKKLDGKLEIGEVTLEMRVLEGEEEDEYLKKAVEKVMENRKKQKQGRKRKGYFGNDGPKRSRN